MHAIFVTLIIGILLSLINIGSSVALNAINALGSVAIVVSYMSTLSSLILRRIWGSPLPARRFTLGRYGLAINIASLLFLIPELFFYFWPLMQPVTPANLNWSSVIFCAVLLIATVYYVVKARHEYTGPVVQVKRD